MDSTRVARVTYACRSAFYATQGQPQPDWLELGSWQRSAFLNQVRTAIINPGCTAEGLHELFLRERGEAGWAFAPHLDVRRKQDPFLRPWSLLTRTHQIADELVVAVVNTFRPVAKA